MVKKIFANFALVTVSIVFALGATEVIFRLWIATNPSSTKPQVQYPHEIYGWHVIPNLSLKGKMKDLSGESYNVNYSTNEHGFRSWGDIRSDRPKILILGDSHTHGEFISDGNLYFSKWKEIAEVFAYGNGGFSNLQELMVLNDFLTIIKPDVIIWQLSSNDIVNNSFELESLSVKDNNGLRRPYLEDGAIVYRLPKPFPHLRKLGINYSKLMYFLFSRWDMHQAQRRLNLNESLAHLLSEGMHDEELQRAAKATAHIISMFIEKSKGIPVYIFMADAEQPQIDYMRQIVMQLGLSLIDIHSKLVTASLEGRELYTFDGIHWNNEGHRIVGEEILQTLLKREQFLPGGTGSSNQLQLGD